MGNDVLHQQKVDYLCIYLEAHSLLVVALRLVVQDRTKCGKVRISNF